MSLFTVDQNCVKCGLCAELCITKIIRFAKGESPRVPPEDEAECMRCGQCVAFCPKGSCRLSFQPAEERSAVDAARLPSAVDVETFLRSRRSVRRYQDKLVDAELISRILETARYAPTAGNSQMVRWVVTASKAKTLELAAMVVDTIKNNVEKGGITGLAAKKQARVVDAWDKGVDAVFRGAPQVAIALLDKHAWSVDAAIALTYFELAAHANGIGCCWTGYFVMASSDNPAINQAVGVRPNEAIVGGQMFGYPKGIKLGRILPPRKRPDVTWL